MVRFGGGIDAPDIGGGSSGGSGSDGGGDDDDDSVGGGTGGRTTPDDDDPRLPGGGGGAPEDDDNVNLGGGTGGRTTPDDDDPRLPGGGGDDGDDSVGGGTGGRTTPDDDDPRLPGGGGSDSDTSTGGGDQTPLTGDGDIPEPPSDGMAGEDDMGIDEDMTVRTRSDRFTADEIIEMSRDRGRDRQMQRDITAASSDLGLALAAQNQRRARDRDVTAASSDVGLALAAQRDQPDVTAASSDVALGLAAQRDQPDVTAQSADVGLALAAQRDQPDVTAASSDVALSLAAQDAAPDTRRDRIRAAGAGFGTGEGGSLSDLPTDAGGPTGRLLPADSGDIPSDVNVEGEVERAAIDPVVGSEVAQTVLGPAGDVEAQLGEEVIERSQPLVGAPGDVEAAAGDLAFDVADASGAAAQTLRQDVVEPGAEFLAETGGVGPGAAVSTALGGDSDAVVSARRRIARGAGIGATEATVGLPRALVEGGATAAEGAEAAATEIEEEGVEGAVDATEAGLKSAGEAGVLAAASAAERPLQTAGLIAGGAVVSAGAGRALGRAARGARSRARTAGATNVDLEEITQSEVVEFFEDDSPGGRRFPAALDEDLFERSQAEALRRQSRVNEPDAVAEQFEQAGVEGTTLQKTLDVEPEGPGRGRAAQGFQVGEEAAGEFETPGASFSSDLSPNFLRVEPRSAEFSLRPGLPDLGDRPTGVFARSRIRETDADTVDEFTQELIEADDSEFRTLPPDEATAQEIEAIAPPGSEFVDVGTGPLRDPLRRLGIGADFATEVRGQRVPLRVVARESDIDTSGSRTPSSLLDDERAQAGAGGSRSRVSRRVSERGGAAQPVDRPFPTAPAGSSAPSDSTSPETPSSPASPPSEPSAPATSPSEPTSPASTPGVERPGPGSFSPPSEPTIPSGVSEPTLPVEPSEPSPVSEPSEPGTPSEPSTPPSSPETPSPGPSPGPGPGPEPGPGPQPRPRFGEDSDDEDEDPIGELPLAGVKDVEARLDPKEVDFSDVGGDL